MFFKFLEIFVMLVAMHFVCDYTFQSDFIAKYKSRLNSLAVVPWYYVLLSHAITHSVGVYVVTQNMGLAVLETACHFGIDAAKNEGKTDIHQDQALHIVCKLVWAFIFMI